MKPSVALQAHRDRIRSVVESHGARNPRVFGSVVHGTDGDSSDLDLLVDPIEGRTTLLSLVRIKRDIEAITGVATDVLTPMSLHERFRRDDGPCWPKILGSAVVIGEAPSSS